MTVINLTTGEVLGENIRAAMTNQERTRGLLDRLQLFPGEGLLIPECCSIHTRGMKIPIDVAFLDKSGQVLQSWNAPAGFDLACFGASSALELPAGSLRNTMAGDRLVVQ